MIMIIIAVGGLRSLILRCSTAKSTARESIASPLGGIPQHPAEENHQSHLRLVGGVRMKVTQSRTYPGRLQRRKSTDTSAQLF